MKKTIIISFIFVIFGFLSLPDRISALQAQTTDEETYDITLTQTADAPKKGKQQTREIDDKKVLTEVYKVQDGDHIWQLFRERGLLQKRNLPELIAILKKLNASLANMDLIHPGETILIPLTIAPAKGSGTAAQKNPDAVISLEDIKKLDLEHYTVKPGDNLVKIITSLYDVPAKDINEEYLELVKKMNPSIGNVNRIFPNQRIRLPIFMRQKIRVPIKQPDTEQAVTEKGRDHLMRLSRELEAVFTQMGEEWVQSGQHFIPLQSGGQVNLNANAYPILNLENGTRIIVDLFHELPEKMAQLIPATWKNYKVMHLAEKDELKDALRKILPLCEYYEIYPPSDPLKLSGDITFTITADWIIQLRNEPSDKPIKVLAITLLENPAQATPAGIKNLLAGLGIKVIEFPGSTAETDLADAPENLISSGDSPAGLLETLFTLLGYPFSKDQDIPVYSSQKSDFSLTFKADFLLHLNDQDYIVDLTGLSPEVLALLKEHRFAVLSLVEEKEPLMMVKKTLAFFKVPAEAQPEPLLGGDRAETKNIKINIPGLTFADAGGQAVLATPFKLPDELTRILARKGIKVLSLNPL
jgi:hypothetical protein